MDAFTGTWNSLFVWPITGALLYLTTFTGSAGVAIILFTILVRSLMLPLTLTQIRSQRAMMQLQPRLKELQRRHAGDRQRIAQEQMRLYKEAGVNPLAGCLPMGLQMPIWIALYSALSNLASGIGSLAGAPEWVESLAGPTISAYHGSFLWIENLAASSAPDPANPATWTLLILPVLAAVTQWIVQKMSTMPSADPQQQQMNRMMEFMPIMFFVFSLQVGAGLALYWVVSNIYTVVQQRVFVGWGTLPFLGSSALPATAPAPDQDASDGSNQPARRDGPRPPRRRRRGK